MKKYLFVFIILLSSGLFSQTSDFENITYNVGLGSFGSAIGAVINKKPNEKYGKVFLKGLWQGGVGGAIIYGSKKIVFEIPKTKKLEYNWAAKFVNAAGVSIIENASSNKDFWEVWHFNIGFNRFEFHINNKFKFKYKVRPISLALTLTTAINKKPEWELMLRSGEVIFSTSKITGLASTAEAYTLNQVVVFEDNSAFSFEQILAHEFIHVYQNNDYNFINPYFKNPIENLNATSPLFKSLDNIFYWDIHYPIQEGLYLFENLRNKNNRDNFFEIEARFYSPDELNTFFNNN